MSLTLTKVPWQSATSKCTKWSFSFSFFKLHPVWHQRWRKLLIGAFIAPSFVVLYRLCRVLERSFSSACHHSMESSNYTFMICIFISSKCSQQVMKKRYRTYVTYPLLHNELIVFQYNLGRCREVAPKMATNEHFFNNKTPFMVSGVTLGQFHACSLAATHSRVCASCRLQYFPLPCHTSSTD